MSGTNEIPRTAFLIHDRLDRGRPLKGANASFAIAMVDRHGEVRHIRAAARHHWLQVKPPGRFSGYWHANLTPPVGNQEVNELWRDLFGGDDEVPLVFALLGIQNDDRQAEGQGVE